jgi:serine/threonine-protein kinase
VGVKEDTNPLSLLPVPSTANKLPPNTYGELFVSAATSEEKGQLRMDLDFADGAEEMNAHAGHWRLEEGALRVTQAGSETSGSKLVPRAYIAHRYFSADDFTAEVQMTMRPLGREFPDEPDAQHFSELAFRIKDLQVSVFAIPGGAMRLGWRYYTPDGLEQVGNSARDLRNMVEDEMPVPPPGTPFKVRLTLKRRNNGVEVEAFVNRNRFARKFLVGLEGRTGKVALGCRNMHCEFEDLVVLGKKDERPVIAANPDRTE